MQNGWTGLEADKQRRVANEEPRSLFGNGASLNAIAIRYMCQPWNPKCIPGWTSGPSMPPRASVRM